MKMVRTVWLTLLAVFVVAVSAWAAIPDRPVKDIYVQDNAGLLSPETRNEVLKIGHELNEKTTAQIMVVTVESLDDRPIAEYANELFRKWGIGSKDKNNGVLLLISKEPRKLRIEVGYGLEGALPDAYTGKIRDKYLIPALKQDDYNTGVIEAYRFLAGTVAREYDKKLDSLEGAADIGAEPTAETGEDEDEWLWDILTVLLIVGVPILIIYVLYRIFKGGSSDDSDSSSTGFWDSSYSSSDSSDSSDSCGGGDSGGGGSDGDY